MFIPKLGATRQIIQPTVTNLQPVKDAINGMKARYRTNASLPLKPRIEASYAVFKEYVKDLPKDQKAASKQEFIKEMSTLLGINSAPILALLQKKNEVSGACVEAMVAAKNTLDAAPAADTKRSETPPLPISTAGQNTTRGVKQEEVTLGERLANTPLLPVANVPGQKGYLGSAADTKTSIQNLFESIVTDQERRGSFDSTVSDN